MLVSMTEALFEQVPGLKSVGRYWPGSPRLASFTGIVKSSGVGLGVARPPRFEAISSLDRDRTHLPASWPAPRLKGRLALRGC